MNLTRLLISRRKLINQLLKAFFLILLCVFFCEFLIFLIYFSTCDWPVDQKNLTKFNLKTIVLSDIHLLGFKRGHFLDKLKREWNMYTSFQIAVYLFQPNSIFFLGDIFDEGLIADQMEFKKYLTRFFELFSTNQKTDLTVSAGNHDVGFHDRMVYYDPFFRVRFEKIFNSSLIEFKTVNGINIVNVNSMAMKGDNCGLCLRAEYLVEKISSELFKKCSRKSIKLCEHQRPILISHFPLFRKSDLDCNEQDSDYDLNEKTNIKPNLGCLSKRSTNFLLKKLQPKLALNGHTHYGCIKKHLIHLDELNNLFIDEYTLASFNYRNRPDPAFILLLTNFNEFRISKCMFPNENYLFYIYLLVILFVVHFLVR